MRRLFALCFISFLLLTSCGGNGAGENVIQSAQGLVKKESNAITQSIPSVMVLPSDAMLKRMGCLNTVDNQGVKSYVRDYANVLAILRFNAV